ncbi:hypothetical protein CHH28_19285 [Bacterioplanes sanyensis]|uniref:Divergent polysaccharide deacetylase family protein n=1 Tax=Bacterioplanes sanyensis TaxID=1249553 RepID=A0A222FPI1_9GAMM|nr:divergent polysaccharide deacetylase family protein [Bacterioplanes sanyensis]ASP40679.1 hypothetical protein CHH28_19285 [Bacterioplanes sanyensis]
MMARWLCLCWVLAVNPVQAATLLLIIDDLGNNRALGERTLALPGPITVAVLPFTPYAKTFAQRAHFLGHGVMLHAPMANDTGAKLGPGALTETMTTTQLQQQLQDSLAAVPFATGVNNHMGSLLTRQPQAMQAVMQTLSGHGVFFVDSLTSADSVALQQALAQRLPALRRDVFLDHSTEHSAIERQFERAVELAQQRGHAVLIGHPYPESLDFLEQALPALAQRGVTLQSVDQFLRQRLWQRWPASSSHSRYQLQIR